MYRLTIYDRDSKLSVRIVQLHGTFIGVKDMGHLDIAEFKLLARHLEPDVLNIGIHVQEI